ncbi:class I SAM-dependent methyltransferase [Pseudonocardia sp.]|uniref:class I SAM-dependent methyltransferase n=1 Tax=Pseudonocardia sp. TaxID=60912 RepID=UPI003D1419D4
MHDRARSFGAVAGDYAVHRPGYPAAAIDWALGGRTGDVVDLGAGTGKLTESLVARGLRVTAVDPDPEMLAELRRRLPGIDAREGSAEAIPLPDGSVDAVLAGQAMHWFDPARALPEIRRILRPGGVLAAMWNADDDEVDWVAGYHEAAWHERQMPRGGDRPGLPDWPGFAPGERAEFAHAQRLTVEGLIATIGTHSWALVGDPAEVEATYGRVRAYLGSRPETRGEFDLPLVATVLRAVRG